MNANANYNGTEVVMESDFNVVFVNFNYRVGPLGFMGGKEVQRQGDLNAGLLDQRRLLWWVQENIASVSLETMGSIQVYKNRAGMQPTNQP